MTIKEALNVSDRTISFRDAEVLLAAALGVDRTRLHTYPEEIIDESRARVYEEFLKRREQNEPVAHIIGTKEFYGRPFITDARALIPRPETEGLIDPAVAWCENRFRTHVNAANLPCPLFIAELGTGCGNIAITLALELAALHIPATIIAGEISGEALELTKENWESLRHEHHMGNIQLHFVESDMFADARFNKRPFDLLIANLPYVEETWRINPAAQKDVIFYEPDVALFGGDGDGLGLYRQFFAEAPTHLVNDGAIMVEYGETQTPLLLPVIEKAFPEKKATVLQDYAGLDRVVIVK